MEEKKRKGRRPSAISDALSGEGTADEAKVTDTVQDVQEESNTSAQTDAAFTDLTPACAQDGEEREVSDKGDSQSAPVDGSREAEATSRKERVARFFADAGKKALPVVKRLPKRWFIDAFTGMAQGLFVTLIAGTIVKTLGNLIGDNSFGNFLVLMGNIASVLMGAGIGAGIASYLKAPRLVVFSAIVAGFIGAWSDVFITCVQSGSAGVMTTLGAKMAAGLPGNPIGAYVTSLLAIETANLVSGKTKLDILLVPLTTLIMSLAGAYVSWPFTWLVGKLGVGIALATDLQPVLMGIIVSAVMGLLLTFPTSSAAIWVSVATPVLTNPAMSDVQINAMLIAGGAAVVGCACHMVGFAVLSFRENKVSGLISQGLGTSMLQIPNIMRNPRVLIPPVVASIICGPLATGAFGLKCGSSGGGMGTCGFVGIIESYNASIISGGMPQWKFWLAIILLFFVIPALVCWLLGLVLRKVGWIKEGDLLLK